MEQRAGALGGAAVEVETAGGARVVAAAALVVCADVEEDRELFCLGDSKSLDRVCPDFGRFFGRRF